MDETKQSVGRPRRVTDLQHFGLMLPPDLIRRVRFFKALLGQTINDITANALTKYLTTVMTPFATDGSKSLNENAHARLDWAKRELERFEGATQGTHEFIEALKQRKSEYEQSVAPIAREWHLNDVAEQINRAQEDLRLIERRKSYYQNIIKMEGQL